MNDTIVLDTNAIISLFDGNRNIANMLDEENLLLNIPQLRTITY